MLFNLLLFNVVWLLAVYCRLVRVFFIAGRRAHSCVFGSVCCVERTTASSPTSSPLQDAALTRTTSTELSSDFSLNPVILLMC